jgi:hypothetical protein
MNFHLTPQQQDALDRHSKEPLRVIDPRTNCAYFLVTEAEYQAMCAVLEEERHRQAIHATALRNAMGRTDDLP